MEKSYKYKEQKHQNEVVIVNILVSSLQAKIFTISFLGMMIASGYL